MTAHLEVFDSIDNAEISLVPELASILLVQLQRDNSVNSRIQLFRDKELDVLEIIACFLSPYTIDEAGSTYAYTKDTHEENACLSILKVLSALLNDASQELIKIVVNHVTEICLILSELLYASSYAEGDSARSIFILTASLILELMGKDKSLFLSNIEKSGKGSNWLKDTVFTTFRHLIRDEKAGTDKELGASIQIVEMFGTE
jgi:hypothetical protein